MPRTTESNSSYSSRLTIENVLPTRHPPHHRRPIGRQHKPPSLRPRHLTTVLARPVSKEHRRLIVQVDARNGAIGSRPTSHVDLLEVDRRRHRTACALRDTSLQARMPVDRQQRRRPVRRRIFLVESGQTLLQLVNRHVICLSRKKQDPHASLSLLTYGSCLEERSQQASCSEHPPPLERQQPWPRARCRCRS